MKSILKSLNTEAEDLIPGVKELFQHHIKSQTFKKGAVLQKAGSKVKKAFFVKKGLLRSYFIGADDKEHTYMFAPENWYLMDFQFYAPKNKDAKAALVVEALEDSCVEVIGAPILELSSNLPKSMLASDMEKLVNRISALQNRVLLLLGASAEERYQHFLNDYPNLINRVLLKHIASYIGIAPETLSQIRRQKRS